MATSDFGPYVHVPPDAPQDGYPPGPPGTDAHLGLPQSRIIGWKPKERIPPSPLTAEEKEQLILKVAEQFLNGNPAPTDAKLDTSRFYTQEEHAIRAAACRRDRGVPAVAANGGIAYPDGIPRSQIEAVRPHQLHRSL